MICRASFVVSCGPKFFFIFSLRKAVLRAKPVPLNALLAERESPITIPQRKGVSAMKCRNYKSRELLPLAVSGAAQAGEVAYPFPVPSAYGPGYFKEKLVNYGRGNRYLGKGYILSYH